MTIRYTKAIRKQMCIMELVNGMLVGLKNPETYDDCEKKTIKEIAEETQKIRNNLTNDGHFTLGVKQKKSFQETISKIQGVLSSELGEFSGLDFLNALLALVEDVREASKRFTNRVLAYHWSRLNEVLFIFYLQDDTELIKTDDMDKGIRIAQRITAAMEA